MKKIYSILSILFLTWIVSSCQSEDKLVGENMGYLRLAVGTATSVSTKGVVPDNYNPKQLYVEIKNAAGIIVESTDNYTEWEGKQFKLKAGAYTITASSNGFDGNASGVDIPYYKGSTQVTVIEGKEMTADIICKLANVKVTVNFDDSFTKSFKSAVVLIESKVAGISGQNIMMGVQNKSVYFPEGDLKATITVINNAGKPNTLSRDFTKVKARDHYILNYRVSESGSVGDITVNVDETEKEYTYRITVPIISLTQLEVTSANAWSNFALLEGKIASIKEGVELDPAYMKFEYKTESAAEWSECSATKEGDSFKAALKGLTPATSYSYRLSYDKAGDNYTSDAKSFTTEATKALPNGNMDGWYKSGSTWYANTDASNFFWDSSNPGTTTGIAETFVNINPTLSNTSTVHTAGGKSAELKSHGIDVFGIKKFAAASLYSGRFNDLVGTDGAKIDFGQSFTTRPTQLKGWFQYFTGDIDWCGANQPANTVAKGDQDLWSAYIVLTTGTYQLNNTDMAGTSKDFAKLLADDTDNFVVAYGALPNEQCVASSTWKEFTINLVYKNLEKKPTHIIVVFSSSKYGDYFTGSTSSLLYLDDLELIYGDNPQVK
ncbi:DUF4493 domain-containing protein [Parabacteroides sp.]